MDEENPLKVHSHLTEQEKAHRKEEEKKKDEEEKKKNDEEEKKATDAYTALDELGKIKHDWSKKLQLVQKECEGKLKMKRLSKDEKTELFKSIRYGYLHHEELLKMNSNP